MRKKRNAAQLMLLILLTAFVLIVINLALFLGLFARWQDDIPVNSKMIMENLSESQGDYSLSDEGKKLLAQHDLFSMILSNEGHILWQERLPDELIKDYTLQDIAAFTRYYLDDYPVHTYIIPGGLLVIGGQKHTAWKYTLEYSEEMIRQLIRYMPLILLLNLALMILIPLFIQRRWLRHREEERTEWIAGVSHDIRTPLTLVLGNADYICQNSTDPIIAQKGNAILKHGIRIRSLVTNLNTSSKLECGMGEYRKDMLKVSGLVRGCAADIMNQDQDGKYAVQVHVEDKLQNAIVKANEDLFRRMLENLINNSIQHNPEGCEISICLERDVDKNNRSILIVSDNGIGASQATLKVLNRHRLNYEHRLDEHGIGLRLVRQICEYHRWKVQFVNNVPYGFCTRIIIRNECFSAIE